MSVRSKDVVRLNNILVGNMDLNIVNQILYLRNNVEKVDSLKHIIYNLPKPIVKEIINKERPVTEIYSKEELFKYIGELEDYQTVGVAFGALSKKFILGDAVGIGKTAQIAGLINYFRENPNFKVLILTAKDLLIQMQEEIAKFTGLYFPIVTSGGKHFQEELDNMYNFPGVISNHNIVTHSLFGTKMSLDMQFDYLIVDESAVFKNLKSGITQKAKQLSNQFEYVTFMNATSFETNLLDLYSQIDLIDDKLLPPVTIFQNEYMLFNHSGMIPKFLKYKDKAAEEFKSTVSMRYFGRSRKLLTGLDVHDKSIIKVKFVGVTKEQKEYVNMGYPWRLIYESPTTISNIPMTPRTVPKFGGLIEVLEEDTESNSAMVYVEYKEAQRAIADYLNSIGYTAEVLNGENSVKERAEIQDKFRNGEITVLVTNLKRGSNFKNCDHVILYSLQGNTEKMKQIEGRVMRELFPEAKKFTQIVVEKSKEEKFIVQVMSKRAQAALELTNTDKGILPYVVDIIRERINERKK